jgi:hypothetical protein
VLVDTRGPFTAVLYAGANRFGTCLNGPDFTSGGTAPAREVTVHPGQVSVFEQTASGGRSAATMLDGRTGAGVTGVRIRLSNGRLATATVVRGWYLVWWPGRVHGTTVTIETSKGAHTIALPASDRVGAGSSCAGPPGTGCATIGFGTAVGG